MFNGLGMSMASLSRLSDAHPLDVEGASAGISPLRDDIASAAC